MSDNLTPAEVMAHLGLQERRLRRFAVAYESVFDPLPRDKRGHREFTPEAVERIAAALPVLIERPALGMEDVLRRQAGLTTSTPAAAPALAPAAPALELLELLTGLRADVAALRLEVAALRGELAARDVAVVPAAVEAQDEPQDAGLAQGAGAPAEAPSQASESLDGEVLRVVTTKMPRGLKWKPVRYAEAEELLAQGATLTKSGADYVTEAGSVMSWRTVKALRERGVLMLMASS
ncbi:hypothetical protein [Deinococcus sp. 23YEL01]|uniref:hypothetical protein n=1 Tax=Deinococcus sp. 23YEL01 TaxID=2745871 RepID=UPI001E4D075A|nr:hypothetical protein [Deinococcus sp. 23YEL01]MCD0170910.1 hypothetical protein [Deinococcus sp. 23YEL01]